MNVLAIDIGGTSIKILVTGQDESRKFPSGPTMTPKRMVAGVKKLARDWKYDAVSIGYPGMVVRNRPLAEPHNLGRGWVGFDFEAAFKHPVKVDQRCGHAGTGKLQAWQDALSRIGDRSRIHYDRGWYRRTHGARSPPLQERDL